MKCSLSDVWSLQRAKIGITPHYATPPHHRRILTHKNDWSRRHRRNDRNNALSVNVETVRRDPNTVGHSTRTTDDRDATYCRDHLSADALPAALVCMRVARTRIFSNVPYKYHNRKVHVPFVDDLWERRPFQMNLCCIYWKLVSKMDKWSIHQHVCGRLMQMFVTCCICALASVGMHSACVGRRNWFETFCRRGQNGSSGRVHDTAESPMWKSPFDWFDGISDIHFVCTKRAFLSRETRKRVLFSLCVNHFALWRNAYLLNIHSTLDDRIRQWRKCRQFWSKQHMFCRLHLWCSMQLYPTANHLLMTRHSLPSMTFFFSSE